MPEDRPVRVLLGYTGPKGDYNSLVCPDEAAALATAAKLPAGQMIFASWPDPAHKAGLRVRRIVRDAVSAWFADDDPTMVEARSQLGIDRKPLAAEPKAAIAPAKARQERSDLADGQIVVLKSPLNPKQPGNKNHARFQAMMAAMKDGRCTVAEALKAGVTKGDLRHDAKEGHVAIVRPGEEGS